VAVFDTTHRRTILRIVYDGPPGSGKTTNVLGLQQNMPAKVRHNLELSDPEGERTQYFDWLEIPRVRIGGIDQELHCQVLTVPGQTVLIERRRFLLATADAVVFVADSQESELALNRKMLRDLIDALPTEHRETAPVHLLIQANKQDRVGALTPDELLEQLGLARPGQSPRAKCLPARASQGRGVFETFRWAVYLAVARLRKLDELGLVPRAADVLDNARERLRTEMLEAESQKRDLSTALDEVLATAEAAAAVTEGLSSATIARGSALGDSTISPAESTSLDPPRRTPTLDRNLLNQFQRMVSTLAQKPAAPAISAPAANSAPAAKAAPAEVSAPAAKIAESPPAESSPSEPAALERAVVDSTSTPTAEGPQAISAPERNWPELPWGEPAAGHVWPPVAARSILAQIRALPVRDSLQLWEQGREDFWTYVGKSGWKLRTRMQSWRFQDHVEARRQLLELARRLARLDAVLPEGKTLILAPDREQYRLWTVTPDLSNFWTKLIADCRELSPLKLTSVLNELATNIQDVAQRFREEGVWGDWSPDLLAESSEGPVYLGEIVLGPAPSEAVPPVQQLRDWLTARTAELPNMRDWLSKS